MRHWTRRGIIGSSLALAACAVFDRPQLGQLYAGTARPPDQPPLILIPGAFGSSLRDRSSGRELWPVSDSRLLLGNYRELELPIDPATLQPDPGSAEAYAVFREGLGRDFYGQLLRTLQRVGGYRRCRPGQPPAGDGACSLYTYVYDFRLDNARAAAGLGALIEQVRADFGDPRLAVDVVAHSNGGLLARYFIRHGTLAGSSGDPDAPASAIRRLLLVGTPNMGTLQPVLSLLRGEEIGLRRIPPEVIATGPGIPQMMPHPTIDWLVDLQGRPLRADLYDVGTWRDFGWSVFDPQIAGRVIELHGGGAAGRR
jgi:pimeloyl-ACP methyl ester carboxylesterase